MTAVATRDSKFDRWDKMEGRDYVANGNTNLGYNGLQYATTQRPLLALHVVEMPVILPVHPILLTMLIILQLLIVEMVLQFWCG